MDQPLGVHPAARVMADVELTGAVADDHRAREQAVVGYAAPQGAFGGNLHRLRRHPGRAEPEANEMGSPRRLIGKAPALMARQLGDDRSRHSLVAHIGHGGGVDHVVAVPGAQHITRLAQEPGLGVGRKPCHLALGERDADIGELANQTRHRHLTAVILRQHEAPRLGAEVADDPRRQRRHHGRPVGCQPALAPKSDHMTAHHQVLDHVVFVAFEPRPRRHSRRDDAILVDDQTLGPLAPALGLAAPPSARSIPPSRSARSSGGPSDP